MPRSNRQSRVSRGRARFLRRGALAGAIALLPSVAAQAADAAAGRSKAQACAACHGANGISQMPGTPHIAGQPAEYLAAQLRAFRSGKRMHEQMNVVAKPLSDADIDSLAAWYASIKIDAKSPGG